MIKVCNKYTKEISYFKFFASEKYNDCFWHTKTTENTGFNLSNIRDFIPIDKTWEEIQNAE